MQVGLYCHRKLGGYCNLEKLLDQFTPKKIKEQEETNV